MDTRDGQAVQDTVELPLLAVGAPWIAWQFAAVGDCAHEVMGPAENAPHDLQLAVLASRFRVFHERGYPAADQRMAWTRLSAGRETVPMGRQASTVPWIVAMFAYPGAAAVAILQHAVIPEQWALLAKVVDLKVSVALGNKMATDARPRIVRPS